MAQKSIKAGSTSHITQVFVADSSSTTGAGLTGLVYNSAGLTCYYKKSDGTASAAITLATITTLGTFNSGGFKEIDATNMPGWYEFHPSNTSISSGTCTTFTLKGATNMVQTQLFLELTAIDNQDAVRSGMTALPNAAAEAAGGLYTRGTGAGQINQPANGMADVNLVRWLGTAASTPTVAGVPNVNVKTWNDLTTVALPLIPTTPGRTLDVSAAGNAGVDWSNVEAPTTTLALTGTTIADSQKVDVHTIKTQTITCAAGVTVYPAVGMTATSNANLETVFDTHFSANYDATNTSWSVSVRRIYDGTSFLNADLLVSELMKSTTIDTVTSQTVFTLVDGCAIDDSYNDKMIVIVDSADDDLKAVGTISDYTGATLTVTLSADPGIFTFASGDKVLIFARPLSAGGGGVSEATLVKYVSLLARSDVALVTDLVTELNNINQDYGSGAGSYTISSDSLEAISAQATQLQTDVSDIDTVTSQFVFTVANQVDSNALTGGGGLDAAGVRAAIGMAAANLDTQLSTIDDFLDTEVAAIKAKTDNLPADPADASDIAAAFSTVNGTLTTIAGYIDTEIGTLQTSVNDIPTNAELATALSGIATTTHLQEVEDKVDIIDTVVDTLNTDIYTAYIEFVDDDVAPSDEYSVRWRKNGVNVTSGITTPLIQVINFAGTDLIASTAMTQIGSTGAYKYTEATNRIASGQNYEVKCTATIDGSARTFSKIISRDS